MRKLRRRNGLTIASVLWMMPAGVWWKRTCSATELVQGPEDQIRYGFVFRLLFCFAPLLFRLADEKPVRVVSFSRRTSVISRPFAWLSGRCHTVLWRLFLLALVLMRERV